MHNQPAATTPGGGMNLVALQTMPCGCVAALYRTRPQLVEIELVEAKGPHCRFYRHRAGQVIGLDLTDSDDGLATETVV
jgi:hypothetical protein